MWTGKNSLERANLLLDFDSAILQVDFYVRESSHIPKFARMPKRDFPKCSCKLNYRGHLRQCSIQLLECKITITHLTAPLVDLDEYDS